MKLLVLINPSESLRSFSTISKKNIKIFVIFDKEYFAKWGKIFELIDNIVLDIIQCENLIKIFRKLNNEFEYIHVISGHDNLNCIISMACEEIGVEFEDIQTIELCRNKYERRVIEKTISSIDFGNIISLEEYDEPKIFPIIVKPKKGWGSEYTIKVNSQHEFILTINNFLTLSTNDHYSNWFYRDILQSGFYWEEWIDGPTITVDIIIKNNRLYFVSNSLATTFINNCYGAGTIIPFNLPSSTEQKLKLFISELVAKLRLSHGFFDIELKCKRNIFFVIDINPRPMGGEMITIFDNSSSKKLTDIYIDLFFNNIYPDHYFHCYSSTHKFMNTEPITGCELSNYLTKIDAIKYISNANLPIPKNTIIARYISKSKSFVKCIIEGERKRKDSPFASILHRPDCKNIIPYLRIDSHV